MSRHIATAWLLVFLFLLCEAHLDCVPDPLCNAANVSSMSRIWCRLHRDPLDRTSPQYIQYASSRLRYLLDRNLIGQDHLKERMVRDVIRKIRNPNEPLIMHFAGDNGVGKSSTAQWISAALSFRCNSVHPGHFCTAGDELLSISGTNYDGLSIESFRSSVVPMITDFIKKYPRGVVILNDLTALHPRHVNVLLPLLGRSPYFSENPEVDIRTALVIVTTDFGRQGRTVGKSMSELHDMIEAEVRSTFGSLAGSHLRTYGFVPITILAARRIARLAFEDWGCSEHVNSLVVSDEVIAHVVDECVSQVATENGRAVSLHMDSVLGALHRDDAISGHNVTVVLQEGNLLLIPSTATIANDEL